MIAMIILFSLAKQWTFEYWIWRNDTTSRSIACWMTEASQVKLFFLYVCSIFFFWYQKCFAMWWAKWTARHLTLQESRKENWWGACTMYDDRQPSKAQEHCMYFRFHFKIIWGREEIIYSHQNANDDDFLYVIFIMTTLFIFSQEWLFIFIQFIFIFCLSSFFLHLFCHC